MGHEVEKIVLNRNDEIVARIDNEKDWQEQWEAFLLCDVAIEFSMPDVAVANLRKCFDNHIPVVSGTTGWHTHLAEVCAYCQKQNGSFVYGTNFSIGVNLFFKAAEMLAKQMGKQTQYKAEIEEVHHIHKKDKPSGTAITMAEVVLPYLSGLNDWVSDTYDEPNKLTILSRREGEVSGIHSLRFVSEGDEIELTHNAHNRSGFAQGAVKAAEWLVKNGGIHDFRDVFDAVLS